MATNPYATQLGDGNPLDVINQTPGKLNRCVQTLGSAGLKEPWAPGKWTAGQIICHLADTEIAFSFRIRQVLAEPHHIIQPFDQDAWSKGYSQLDPQLAAQVFAALRGWNLALIKTVSQETFEKPVSHPERGQMTFRTLLETMAGHDLNHLRQLETVATAYSRRAI
ncbi:MAG: DinB family protein [Acidobacteriaceae bacterium]|nr:DinB family protein [Acidobacteriaceae bacterium]